MKKAVAYLIPFMEEAKRAALIAAGKNPDSQDDNSMYAGTVLLATVKGDVHDIGKNIVGVVLGCNNYKVIDIGVMVSCDKIIEAAIANRVDVVGLSGLITPSLDEMVYVGKEMAKAGLKVPLLIGGATTSRMHTAVKISPQYANMEHPVIHVLDASRSVVVVSSLLDARAGRRTEYVQEVLDLYEELREEHYASLEDRKYITLQQARTKALRVDWPGYAKATATDSLPAVPWKPATLGTTVIQDQDIASLLPYIDWNPFFAVFELRGKYPNRGYPKIFDDANVGPEARKLFDDAQAMLKEIVDGKWLAVRGVAGIYPAGSVGDDINVYAPSDDATRGTPVAVFHGLRQQVRARGVSMAGGAGCVHALCAIARMRLPPSRTSQLTPLQPRHRTLNPRRLRRRCRTMPTSAFLTLWPPPRAICATT